MSDPTVRDRSSCRYLAADNSVMNVGNGENRGRVRQAPIYRADLQRNMLYLREVGTDI